MFNEEQKRNYIEWKERNTICPEGYLERVFRKAERFEKMFNKDISNFNIAEIEYFHRMQDTPYLNVLVTDNGALALYTDWCIKHNFTADSRNHFREITHDSLNGCANKLKMRNIVISKEMIYDWIEELVNPRDQFAVLALYEGINGTALCELAKLRLSDFDGNKVILHTGKMFKDDNGNETEVLRTITVSNKLVHLALQAADEDKYYERHSKDGDVYYTEKCFIPDGDLIIKNLPNTKPDISAMMYGRRIKNIVNRVQELMGIKKLNSEIIIKSGMINYVNERCEALRNTSEDIDLIYKRAISEAKTQFNRPASPQRFHKEYKELLVA